MDMHSHSTCSDGTDTPTALVERAANLGISMLAITDHDTMDGVEEAMTAGEKYDVMVVPGVELDNEWHEELHIVGLGVNAKSGALFDTLKAQRERRNKRNKNIVVRLAEAGFDISTQMKRFDGDKMSVTRMHIAISLYEAGYAHTVNDAFRSFLAPGKVGYANEQRLTPEESISLILESGGLPVLAHPCHLKVRPHETVRVLKSLGLWGIEVYYPSSTPGQKTLFDSLAKQYGLYSVCASDFHGKNRPSVELGCTWSECDDLVCTRDAILAHMREKNNVRL